MLKAWVPALFRDDWIMKALTSSLDQSVDGFRAEGNMEDGPCRRESWLEGDRFWRTMPLATVSYMPFFLSLFPYPCCEQLRCSHHVEALPITGQETAELGD